MTTKFDIGQKVRTSNGLDNLYVKEIRIYERTIAYLLWLEDDMGGYWYEEREILPR